MNNARTTTRTTAGTTQQLTLLPDLAPASNANARFLLSQDTRELGMRQVAEIRQMLAERKATREASAAITPAVRTRRAA